MQKVQQKEEKTEDPRLRRTRNVLKQALIDLTIERGFAAITVRDICERAMVNRSTFYRNYLDKYDLLEKYMDEMYEVVSSTQEVLPSPEPGAATPPQGLIVMLDHIRMNADFFRVMLGEKGDAAFTQRVRQYIEKRLRDIIPAVDVPTVSGRPPLDLGIRYTAQAGIGALLWWLEDKQPCTAEQLATWLSRYAQADISLSFAP